MREDDEASSKINKGLSLVVLLLPKEI